MYSRPRLSHRCGEVERFEDVSDLWAKLNFRAIASTGTEIKPVLFLYARQAYGMRLEYKVFIASDEVPSSPIHIIGGAFLYDDAPTSITDHLDGVIQKRRIPEDLHRAKGFRH
jgi:hypothetical protein